ncbi:MAG: nucleotidyltransferase domain-containing protein [Synechococcales bacterium]|nr:nucleotidyltransferase domain-containing protein [Synechococcales bacterium]
MIEPAHLDYWRKRKAEQVVEQQALAAQAWEDVKAISTVLQRDFGATQIILFGSLVKQRFHANSDIDIAAAGIPAMDYFAAVAAVNQVSRRWVDLKPLEALEPHFRDRILAEGTLLYAAN